MTSLGQVRAKANRGVEGQTLSSKAESVSPKHGLRPPRTMAPGAKRYGLTVTITTPCDTTGAENFPVNLPKSLCAHKSRTAALR